MREDDENLIYAVVLLMGLTAGVIIGIWF